MHAVVCEGSGYLNACGEGGRNQPIPVFCVCLLVHMHALKHTLYSLYNYDWWTMLYLHIIV